MSPPARSEAVTVQEVESPVLELKDVLPWQQLRIDEIDRQLGAVLADVDPNQRQNDLHYVLVVCISPLADELGLSTPTINDGVLRDARRSPDEHLYTFGNKEYRIPLGMFPALDDYMAAFVERNERLRNLSPAEAALGLSDPFPLDARMITELERLAERAQSAIRRRTEIY